MALVLALLALIAWGDYESGYKLAFSIFYLAPIAISRWYLGPRFSVSVALASLILWITCNRLAGKHYDTSFILLWNSSVIFGYFIIVILLMGFLRSDYDDLDRRVTQRTAALLREANERRRLEHEVLGISEHEQQRIGNDLHDTICQHLSATALAAEVLAARLEQKQSNETEAAHHIVKMVEESIQLARGLAMGLSPVEVSADGLMDALHRLAAYTTRQSNVGCELDYDKPLRVANVETATHLYRIVHESINNAVKHAKANMIVVSVAQEGSAVRMTIRDDGVGYKENTASKGMGIRIMAYRASMMEGTFDIQPNPSGGTIVTCLFPKLLDHAQLQKV